MKSSIVRKHTILLTLLILLQGCGFHLRGAYEVPAAMDPTFVQAPENDRLAREIRQAISDSGAGLANDPQQAKAVLRLIHQQQNRRTRAVDSRGKVIDYELTYQVEFDMRDKDGAELLPTQSITLRRTQVNADIEVLGKQEEQALFFQDMRREMAGQILGRIKTQLR